MGAWERCQKPLFSERYRLTGKPDYVVRQGRVLIPVEVKPRRQALQPYASDIMQLAAYCLLLEDERGQSPPCGLIRYQSETFRIPYTRALRAQLLTLLDEIRQQADAPDVLPNHHEPRRCLGCGHRAHCEHRLA